MTIGICHGHAFLITDIKQFDKTYACQIVKRDFTNARIFGGLLFQLLKFKAQCEDHKIHSCLYAVRIYDFHRLIFTMQLQFAYMIFIDSYSQYCKNGETTVSCPGAQTTAPQSEFERALFLNVIQIFIIIVVDMVVSDQLLVLWLMVFTQPRLYYVFPRRNARPSAFC